MAFEKRVGGPELGEDFVVGHLKRPLGCAAVAFNTGLRLCKPRPIGPAIPVARTCVFGSNK